MLNKEQKKKRAEALQLARASRTPEQQIKKLDDLLGVGKGAVRERARLAKQMKEAQEQLKKAAPKGKEEANDAGKKAR